MYQVKDVCVRIYRTSSSTGTTAKNSKPSGVAATNLPSGGTTAGDIMEHCEQIYSWYDCQSPPPTKTGPLHSQKKSIDLWIFIQKLFNVCNKTVTFAIKTVIHSCQDSLDFINYCSCVKTPTSSSLPPPSLPTSTDDFRR